jgi:hypothetical protein
VVRRGRWIPLEPVVEELVTPIKVHVKLGLETVDTPLVGRRRRSRYFRAPKVFLMRTPDWRSAVAVRVGMPILGTIAGVMFAWVLVHRF